MSSTKWNSEVRQLFRETQVRYPHQNLEPETIKAYLEDWRIEVERVGFKRFEEGVKRARTYCDFFPMVSKIRDLIPDIRNDNEAIRQELSELRRRKDAGERFYTLADVFETVADKIRAGEIKPSNPSWIEWAKHFKKKSLSAIKGMPE